MPVVASVSASAAGKRCPREEGICRCVQCGAKRARPIANAVKAGARSAALAQELASAIHKQ
eukprot:3171988-Pyramimonas_sp.AAC.1